MSEVWTQIEALATHFKNRFDATGQVTDTDVTEYNWHNTLWDSPKYRRAHLEIVDKRDTHKIYIVHCTVFPHVNDSSPIWGFDAVCGPNKITGAFHDFSTAGNDNHPMMQGFANMVTDYAWNKPRELPEWARAIFSKNMVAAGNVRAGEELDALCNLAVKTLDYYLENVGNTQQDTADYRTEQNRYCHYQKQNPHVVRSMVAMGIDETKMKQFVQEVLFPEIH